jgi:hypothetical protein
MSNDERKALDSDALSALLQLLAVGEQDIASGRTRPAREVIAELDPVTGLPTAISSSNSIDGHWDGNQTMASDKTLNAKNLSASGADRLAGLLLELAAGDAAAKRKLRLELAGNAGSGGAAAEIRKRLVTIARSRSFVDWHKSRAFAKDLETQREAIIRHVAPGNPAEAFDLIWRFLDMAPSIYERCDDSNGTIGGIMDRALEDLGEVAKSAKLPAHKLAERIFASVCANDTMPSSMA